MEMKVQIPFQQLLTAVKTLSGPQKARLQRELSEEEPKQDKTAFIEMLLNGPVFTEKDIDIIEENRKSIAAWRTAN
jgi:hypothetical protein